MRLLTRPVARPPKRPQMFFASFTYQAQSRAKPQRVVAKVEWHQGELSPRVRFIVTDLPLRVGGQVLQRAGYGGAVDQGRQGRAAQDAALVPHLPANAVRLQLVVLADKLANFLCALALPDEAAQRTLITLREKLIRIGARIVRHCRDVVFQLAEMEVPRALSTTLLRRIARLRGPPVPAT